MRPQAVPRPDMSALEATHRTASDRAARLIVESREASRRWRWSRDPNDKLRAEALRAECGKAIEECNAARKAILDVLAKAVRER